ncbi:MAG: GWxTD domain-containing protein [Chitinophagales bacterium]
MKKTLLLFTLVFFIFLFPKKLKAIEVIVENKNFWAPGKGTYVETGLMILGGKLKYLENESGKLSAAVDVLLLFKNEEGIVAFDKYRLNREIIDSSEINVLALIDRKRFALDEGVYSFQLLVKDANNPSDTALISEMHTVDIDPVIPNFSDIQLIEDHEKSSEDNSVFVKNGLFMLPQIVQYYPKTITRMSFYAELYHSEKYVGEDALLITYNVRRAKNKEIVADLNGYKKVQSAEVVPFLAGFNISDLPTGNYILRLEARNKENELICRKELNFQRDNPLTNKPPTDLVADKTFVEGFDLPSIRYQLRSFIPIADAAEAKEINTLVKKGELEALKQFFLKFWVTRDPVDPYLAWYEYTEKVKKVNDSYSTNLLYGFETDRGRVYLQYGAPNQLLEAPRQAGSNPYEIWHYYDNIGRQTNVKFVFLNRDLISNNYELIHSTALGEIKNEQWRTLVQSKGFNSPVETQQRSNDFYGNQINDFFDQ